MSLNSECLERPENDRIQETSKWFTRSFPLPISPQASLFLGGRSIQVLPPRKHLLETLSLATRTSLFCTRAVALACVMLIPLRAATLSAAAGDPIVWQVLAVMAHELWSPASSATGSSGRWCAISLSSSSDPPNDSPSSSSPPPPPPGAYTALRVCQLNAARNDSGQGKR